MVGLSNLAVKHCWLKRSEHLTVLFPKGGIYWQVLWIASLAVGKLLFRNSHFQCQRICHGGQGEETRIYSFCFQFWAILWFTQRARLSFPQIAQICIPLFYLKHFLYKVNIMWFLIYFFILFSTFPTFGELCICLADINPGFGGKTGKRNFQSATHYFWPQKKYEQVF